jgi:hypothetical protein
VKVSFRQDKLYSFKQFISITENTAKKSLSEAGEQKTVTEETDWAGRQTDTQTEGQETDKVDF